MRVFNSSSTAMLVGDRLVPAGEHGDVDDNDRARALIDAGHLVEADGGEPDEAATPRKRGGTQ